MAGPDMVKQADAALAAQEKLANAIGFSEPGATIRMGAKRSRNTLQLWVSDSGRGIEPEFQKQAFDRFQSRPVPGGHRGPGLGLAIVKHIIEAHGQTITVTSSEGKGTTFSFTLEKA